MSLVENNKLFQDLVAIRDDIDKSIEFINDTLKNEQQKDLLNYQLYSIRNKVEREIAKLFNI
ncbi:hypothetical protein EV694_1558 [Volucribacter psittacicida]|uniref:Uncharacterized protein n=1 Tax=Volucribacter psittacicida TaxID=203482 RepID=A0A4R1G2P2_9PAST|nr:hypothetical protein EV694_1558 [Volucribacter psittacicida]